MQKGGRSFDFGISGVSKAVWIDSKKWLNHEAISETTCESTFFLSKGNGIVSTLKSFLIGETKGRLQKER